MAPARSGRLLGSRPASTPRTAKMTWSGHAGQETGSDDSPGGFRLREGATGEGSGRAGSLRRPPGLPGPAEPPAPWRCRAVTRPPPRDQAREHHPARPGVRARDLRPLARALRVLPRFAPVYTAKSSNCTPPDPGALQGVFSVPGGKAGAPGRSAAWSRGFHNVLKTRLPRAAAARGHHPAGGPPACGCRPSRCRSAAALSVDTGGRRP